jgi:hypothetical protein
MNACMSNCINKWTVAEVTLATTPSKAMCMAWRLATYPWKRCGAAGSLARPTNGPATS